MPGDSFAHLHVHTEYSMLDGAARLGDMFGECARLGMPAVAMTDHGNLYGAFDFYEQATAAGLKPIIGIEAYVAPASRFRKEPVFWGQHAQRSDDVSGRGSYTHLTMLAADADGLRNLFRLASLASLEGNYRKWPRMDRELLARYSTGLIATTSCPSGEVQTRLRLGQYAEALAAASDFRDIFGAENFFLELMDHGNEVERRVRDDLTRLGKELDLSPLATNDSHYTYGDDAKAHEVLLCVQTGKTISDESRLKFDGEGYHIKSPQEMRALWDDQVPGACDNTLLVAERVGSYAPVFASRNLLPQFPVPDGESEESWLRTEVWRGLERRFPGGVGERYRRQAEYELDIICQKGYPGYFLVVADLVRYAKQNGIRVGPGRGSAAGAVIAYALGITELDPLEHKLLFERFLNPERMSMPDIDMDFDERRRADMIRYTTEQYGDDRVAQIITYGTIKAKAAIKDAARVLGYPYALGDRITKAMPPAVMGKDIPLAGIFDPAHPRYGEAVEIRRLIESEHDVKEVVQTARGLEGLKRQWGVHAAGVILSRDPLLDVIPIQRREQDGAVITQFDMGASESLGLLKMDFLGLRNLTVLDDCLRNIEVNRGEKLVLEEIGLDDRPTYDLLTRGDTLGVFQLDGGPMRSLLRAMRPDNFEDISAVGALYRPGPMGANAHIEYADRKNGRKPVSPIHPELEEPLAEILGDTYGLIVYQEQVMAIAQKVADYSLGQADLLRRAMGKKKKEVLDKEYVPFSEGMRARGYSDRAIQTLWDILVPFSDYAFNKAHSAAYGVVSYWTAYLKANYPAEYMAALLTSVQDDKDKSALYLAECRRMGIKVLPPDVNESRAQFTPVGDDIRFGLAAVRNVGSGPVESIMRCRKQKGAYTSFYDFCGKIDAVVCNKRVVESLIKSGAFDSLGHSRRGLTLVHDQTVDSFLEVKRQEAVGQFDLFGAAEDASLGGASAAMTPPIPGEEWNKSTLLAFEREMLGLYVSSHPLQGFEHVLRTKTDTTVTALATDDLADAATVTIGGIISGIQRKITKQGRSWAIVTVEDLEGAVDAMFFPASYEQYAAHLAEDTVVVVKGRLDKREEAPRVMASELATLDINEVRDDTPIVIGMSTERVTPELVAQLRDVLNTHPGPSEVHLRLQGAGRTTIVRLDGNLRVASSPALLGDLKALLGPACVA